MTKLSTIYHRINEMLRRQYNEVLNEPLPKRWVDLVNYLEQQDSATHDNS